MKKLGKLTLKELKQEVNVLSAGSTRELKGGESVDEYGNIWYTASDMYKLSASGQWNGGYVEGMGYVSSEATACGEYMPEYPPVVSKTLTFCDWTASGSAGGTTWADETVEDIISFIPGLGDAQDYILDTLTEEKFEATTILLRAGFTCDDKIQIDTVVGDDLSIYYDLYDLNGNFIATTK